MLAAPAETAVVEEPPKAPTPPPPAGNANIYVLQLAWSCFDDIYYDGDKFLL